MRVTVNADRCDAHGLCAELCPEVFLLGDDDQLRVLIEEPAENLRGAVEAAARRCPKAAITVA